MTAMVSSSRARSTWLTGTAGLLILAAAFVMMLCAAPGVHQVRHESVTRDRLASSVWIVPAARALRGPVNPSDSADPGRP
jgi:hypothetical protein